MNKKNMLILILMILSTIILTGYAQTNESGANISTNETIAVSTPVDTITINENTSTINITKNSNETTVAETMIKDGQTKSSPGFSLTDTVISLITAIILIAVYKIGR